MLVLEANRGPMTEYETGVGVGRWLLRAITLSGAVGAAGVVLLALANLCSASGAPSWRVVGFAAAALGFSMFYGLGARSMFTSSAVDSQMVTWWRTAWPYKMHQFWFNFVGSLVGWGCAWPLLEGFRRNPHKPEFQAAHALYFIVAFLGITGWLPYAMAGLASSLKAIAEKVAK